MKVHIPVLENGVIPDRFGKRGTQFNDKGMPTYSLPFIISNAPEETQSFAVILDDKDAVTAAGFVWTHWLIADLTQTEVPENDSQNTPHYTQGANSWASVLGQHSPTEAACYGGMAPPNCLHRYDLTVYALDTRLNLPQGFLQNELHYAMQGHILAQASTTGIYDV